MAIIATYTSTADVPPYDSTSGSNATYKSTDVAEYFETVASANVQCPLPSKVSDFWFACDIYPRGTSNSPLAWIRFGDSAYSNTQELFAIEQTATSTGLYRLMMWNGTAWVAASSETFAFAANQLHRVDINIKVADTGGVFQFWDNGTLLATGTIDDTKLTPDVTGINYIQFNNFGSGLNRCAWSRVIVADEDTRAMKMIQVLPTGNGGDTAWTGAYTDVDEISYIDTDYATTSTSGAKETYTHAALPVAYATGYEVKAVVVSGRMSAGQNSGLGVKSLFRIGGVDYEGAAFPMSIQAGPAQVISPINPATGLAWTYAQAVAEFGVSAYTI